ncbi:MAG TPA: hypothetical protein VFH94_16360 [Streptomyces sp.]|nr:hypothetical protein [Streptomyces sp.]
MKIVHMVRAGIVMLALLIAPGAAMATAHAQSADSVTVVAAPSNVAGGDTDTPWGP